MVGMGRSSKLSADSENRGLDKRGFLFFLCSNVALSMGRGARETFKMWSSFSRVLAAAASGAALLTLSACDSGASAVAARDHAPFTDLTPGAGAEAPAARAAASQQAPAIDPRTQPVRQVDGRPVWAPNRRLGADEAALANFERNGADFGVRSVEAWITRVHDFVESPPRGVQRLTRSNGDVLLYDPAANVFAVVTAEGAPRTMFRPREGAAYWEQQKTLEASRVARAAERQTADASL
jgi:pyocin large subunit-like protein